MNYESIVGIWNQYVAETDSLKLKCLVVLTLILFALSVICAIRDRRFQFAILTNTIDRALIPLYGGLCVIALVVIVQPEWSSFIPSMWGVLNLTIFGLIAQRLKSLGLPLPTIPFLGLK